MSHAVIQRGVGPDRQTQVGRARGRRSERTKYDQLQPNHEVQNYTSLLPQHVLLTFKIAVFCLCKPGHCSDVI